MAQREKTQRIKLRPEGSPVKYNGDVIRSTPDGKVITVRFDAVSMRDEEMLAYGTALVSNAKDLQGNRTNNPLLLATGQWWEVL